jgi:hypothetical protein
LSNVRFRGEFCNLKVNFPTRNIFYSKITCTFFFRLWRIVWFSFEIVDNAPTKYCLLYYFRMDEQACPRCKTTKYRNPSLRLMVNICGHALCESCVDLLFLKGMHFVSQFFKNTTLKNTFFSALLLLAGDKYVKT